jgi:hypothetical protein
MKFTPELKTSIKNALNPSEAVGFPTDEDLKQAYDALEFTSSVLDAAGGGPLVGAGLVNLLQSISGMQFARRMR